MNNNKKKTNKSNSHSFIFNNKPKSSSLKLKPFSLAINKSPTKISKLNMDWNQAKKRYPKLKPFDDADGDGVVNVFDCKPFNRKKQGIYQLPLSKKGYYRELRKRSPIVVQHRGGDLIETFGEKGITSYRKVRSEKLAQVNRDYPNEEPRTIQDQIELEKGNARGVLAKGRTPGKIIFRQRGYKPRGEYDYGKGEEKVRQLAVVDVNTGDIDTFQESSKWSKAAIEKERMACRDEGDISPQTYDEKYYPQGELIRTQESSNIEVLNPSPIDEIREKRKALRVEARDKDIVEPFQEGWPASASEAPEETLEAFKQVTEPETYTPEEEPQVEVIPADEADEYPTEEEKEEQV